MWRNYEWTSASAGRLKGHVESLSPDDPVTQTWQRRGWIRPVAKPSAPSPPKPEEKDLKAPPRHRAMKTGDFESR